MTSPSFLGNGDGTFETLEKRFPVRDDPRFVTAADIDGDGNADLVVMNWESRDISVLLGNGDGTFQPLIYQRFTAGSEPWAIAAADFDGDGDVDVAVSHQYSDDVYVLLNGTVCDKP